MDRDQDKRVIICGYRNGPKASQSLEGDAVDDDMETAAARPRQSTANNLPEPSVLLRGRGYDAGSILQNMAARTMLTQIPMRKMTQDARRGRL
jgi:hypothetical protein